MSSDGGAPHGADEPTSFALQPPRPAVPYPGNPYARPQEEPDREPSASGPEPSTSAHAASRPPRDPGAGRLIAGRYRLLARLGHGGMGTVWRAKDETVDREVAVKEPRVPDSLPDRERGNVFERMRREARAAARLDHPAVVDVYDVAVVEGRPWIVMELVRGRSLGVVLQEEGTLGVRDAARIGLEILGALEAAHEAGVLHRDVKPDNVLLGRHDRVVLTDFGIARIEGDTNLTDTGSFVGSPEYIAPERVLGQRPGPASDLWSLGVVLYAATEGVSPFRRGNTPATLQSVLNATPAAPASARGPLAEAIDGLLNKDPARRPTAARVRALLEEAVRPPAPTEVIRAPRPDDGADDGEGRRPRPARGALLGLGAAVVAAAVAAYLVVTDPFAGPLPEGWKEYDLGTRAGASLGVPAEFTKNRPADDADGTAAGFTDPSGLVWVSFDREPKPADAGSDFPDSASLKAYEHWASLRDGNYSAGVADDPAPRGEPKETTFKERKAAENTVVYTTTDVSDPRLREARYLFYRADDGDLYAVSIDYPGEGHFTEEGREIARTVIANLEIDEL